MADGKPHEATPNRVKRAKKDGNVARSQEFSSLAALVVAALAIAAAVPYYASIDAAWLVRAAADGSVHVDRVAPLLALVAATLLVAGCGGIAASLLQEPPFLKFPTFKPERLNPLEGVKRMFAPEAALAGARAIFAFALATAALIPTANEVFARSAGFSTPAFFAMLAASAATRIVALVVVVAAVFAIFDVLLVRGRWRKKLRMTTYELKRDLRETDGDPRLRGQRRRMHRRLNRGALRAVRQAAFVVTNPTHIAMALEYRPPDVAVPRVLVRAADEAAHRVRELAREHGVPLIENVALARELYALTEPGDEIPIESYIAVAEIVNALMKQGALA